MSVGRWEQRVTPGGIDRFVPLQVGSAQSGSARPTSILFLFGSRMISLNRRSGRQSDPLSLRWAIYLVSAEFKTRPNQKLSEDLVVV